MVIGQTWSRDGCKVVQRVQNLIEYCRVIKRLPGLPTIEFIMNSCWPCSQIEVKSIPILVSAVPTGLQFSGLHVYVMGLELLKRIDHV